MLKDLRLSSRDRSGLVALLVVPIVVIAVVASATQSGNAGKSIIFPVVNEDQGPVATALIAYGLVSFLIALRLFRYGDEARS
jgi:hypothetical protein